MEKDVNLDVVYALKSKLESEGHAHVVLTRKGDEYLPSRRERVNIASDECESLYGKKCDALVSVHHNGSTDPAYDGLLVILTQNQDLPLAKAVHDALLNGMSYPTGGTCYPYSFTDEGLLRGGYGMTKTPLVSILTEAWYLTNDCQAQRWLAGGANQQAMIDAEVNAIYNGLANYFGSQSGGGKKR